MAPKINQIEPDESINNEKVVNESINNVSSKGESKLKKAVNNAIAKMAIVLSLTGTAAPEVATSTIVPEAVATITTMAPATGTALKAIAIGTSGALLAACEDPDEIGPNIKIPDEILKSGISIEKPEILSNNGTTIRLGNIEVAVCSDESGMGAVTVNVNGKIVKKGESITIDKSCSATINAADTHGNPSSKTFRINYIDTSPEYISYKTEVPVSQGDKITRNNGEIFAGTEKTFAFNSDEYTISLKLGKGDKYEDITNHLPFSLDEVGDRNLEQTLISKKNGKSKSRTTTIKVSEVDNNQPPEVTREYPQDKVPNILGGVNVKGDNNQLTFGDVVMYTGKDDNTEACTISLKLKGSNEEKTGKKITESGTYVLRYIDKDGKSSSPTEFSVKSESIDLTNLNLNMQVNQEVDLLEGIKAPSGIEITKVEVEIGGQRQEVKAKDGHYLYTPNQPGTCYIYVTEKGEFGNTYVEKSKNPLTIKDIEYPEYQSITINNIEPTKVFPEISQIQSGDPNIYEYIKEDMGIAEVYVMRNMITKYGTGKYTPEQISELQSRLNYGLIEEMDDDYQEHGWIGPVVENPYTGDHANKVFKFLTKTKGEHTNIKNLSGLPDGDWARNLSEYANAHPNELFIFSCSATVSAYSQKDYKQLVFRQSIVNLCDLPNVLIFMVGGDTKTIDGEKVRILYNGIYDEVIGEGRYVYSSMANSDQDNHPNSNMRVVVGTNTKGDANMDNANGSLFPRGFNDNVLISGRPILPIENDGHRRGEDVPKGGSYYGSLVTPAIASTAEMVFGLCPDVKDANELLKIIESNTAGFDYIGYNGNKKALKKYSPINVARAISIDVDIPSTIKPGETVTLTKKGYLGLIFDIPGAEVKINGEWIPYNKSKEALIKSQNPMNLEWRISADEAMKYGKKNLKGKIKAVDDQWNGVRVEKDISININ